MDYYEKLYKEALERARHLHKDAIDMGENIRAKQCEIIFPELAESEDEKIRKEIIEFLQHCVNEHHIVVKAKWFAWLEKQGQEPKKVSIWKHWKNGIAGNGEGKPIYLIKFGNTYSLSSCLGSECDYIELSELDNLMLEKQGEQEYIDPDTLIQQRLNALSDIVAEQKPSIIDFKAKDWYVSKVDGKIHNIKLEEQSKQKPFDYENANIQQKDFAATRPRFRKGDFIVNKDDNVYKVIGVIENEYRLRKLSGIEFVVQASINIIDKQSHLWTIQDAKDGDVLIDNCDDFKNPLIFILKKFETVDFGLAKPSDFSSYCYLTMSDKQKFKEGGYHHMHNIHPATKEQRELLFSKMKEAGYEWNDEKKELKEIEQDPTWSEKDEYRAIDAICLLEIAKEQYASTIKIEACIDWLKSIKGRYTWKPSDEQIEAIRLARSFVTDDFGNNPTLSEILVELEKQLKKLKGE